jgi:hypothetical protein
LGHDYSIEVDAIAWHRVIAVQKDGMPDEQGCILHVDGRTLDVAIPYTVAVERVRASAVTVPLTCPALAVVAHCYVIGYYGEFGMFSKHLKAFTAADALVQFEVWRKQVTSASGVPVAGEARGIRPCDGTDLSLHSPVELKDTHGL